MAEYRTGQVIGTIQNAPLVTVQGTVTAAGGAGGGYSTVTGTVVVATLQSPVAVGGGTVNVQGTVTVPGMGYSTVTGTVVIGAGTVVIGGILGAPAVAAQSPFVIATVVNGATLVASGAGTVAMGSLQDLVVDATYGTAYPASASMLAQVMSVDPLSGFQTGTVVAGGWFSGTVRSGDRLTANGPLGAYVAIGYVVVGTVAGVYISAQMSL